MTTPEHPITDNMHQLAVRVRELKGRCEDAKRQAEQARAGFRSIRAAIEDVGPTGVMPSAEAVQQLHGPELVHEAEALVDGVRKIAGEHPVNRSR